MSDAYETLNLNVSAVCRNVNCQHFTLATGLAHFRGKRNDMGLCGPGLGTDESWLRVEALAEPRPAMMHQSSSTKVHLEGL